MNLTEYISSQGNKFNGKKLTQSQLNLLAKLDEMGVTVSPDGIATNPVSGYQKSINPFIASLVNWVHETYSTYSWTVGTMHYNGNKVAINTFDRVKMLVLSLDDEAYSDFID